MINTRKCHLFDTAGKVWSSREHQRANSCFDDETVKSFGLSKQVLHRRSAYHMEQNGEQYVSVISGWGGAVPLWGGEVAKKVNFLNQGGMLWTFRLPREVVIN